jgi:hypothetical protein
MNENNENQIQSRLKCFHKLVNRCMEAESTHEGTESLLDADAGPDE